MTEIDYLIDHVTQATAATPFKNFYEVYSLFMLCHTGEETEN